MSYLKGGQFLVKETHADDVFIREEFGEDQQMMLGATQDFTEREIRPHLMRFEEKDYALVEDIIRKACLSWHMTLLAAQSKMHI